MATLLSTLTYLHPRRRIVNHSLQAMNPYHFPCSTTKVSVTTLLQRSTTLINPSSSPLRFHPLARDLISRPLVRLLESNRKKTGSLFVLLYRLQISQLQSRLQLALSSKGTSFCLLLPFSKARSWNRVLLHSCSYLLRKLASSFLTLHVLIRARYSDDSYLDVASSPPFNTPEKSSHPFARNSGHWLVSSSPTRSPQ